MRFTIPELPFEAASVSDWISHETLDIHYGVHHRQFADQLNVLLAGSELEDAPLQDIIRSASGPLLNNASEFWNHCLYWFSISPNPHRNSLKDLPELKARLAQGFGSVEGFIHSFSELANSHFGAGWLWLAEETKTGTLRTLLTKDAGCLISGGFKPLLTCDLWEHAYYIDYRNNRSRYVEGFIRSINWKFVDSNLHLPKETIISGGNSFSPLGARFKIEKIMKEKR